MFRGNYFSIANIKGPLTSNTLATIFPFISTKFVSDFFFGSSSKCAKCSAFRRVFWLKWSNWHDANHREFIDIFVIYLMAENQQTFALDVLFTVLVTIFHCLLANCISADCVHQSSGSSEATIQIRFPRSDSQWMFRVRKLNIFIRACVKLKNHVNEFLVMHEDDKCFDDKTTLKLEQQICSISALKYYRNFADLIENSKILLNTHGKRIIMWIALCVQ